MPTGQLRAKCSKDLATISFRSTPRSASADIVVASKQHTLAGQFQPGHEFATPPLSRVDFQTWSIAPFAEAEVRPTLITVAAKPAADGTIYSCAVAAYATVGPSGGTLTQ
ncbi:MAG: hypothetical protein JJE13_13105 [Thermoleophilia bacterium]|nr:hypothetical protein [Thermoleophilia bacterium]